MAKVVSVCNQKGGVGKSTTAVNVGSYFAMAGKRTLLVDLDAQGNATICCGVDRARVRSTVHSVIVDGMPIDRIITRTALEMLDVAPSNVDLSQVDITIADFEDREQILKRAFEPIASRYDLILLDCPPSLGLMTLNALIASDGVLIPVQCEYLALEGLNALIKAVDRVRQSKNDRLQVLGIVLTMADFRTTLTQEVSKEVKEFFKELVFTTSIPRNIRLAEAPSFGKPICLYDPHSSGALAYDNLAKELMERLFQEQNAGVAAQ